MFKKNMTDWALTTWPEANFQPFSLSVTVLLPCEYTGLLASESEGTRVTLPPRPNQ